MLTESNTGGAPGNGVNLDAVDVMTSEEDLANYLNNDKADDDDDGDGAGTGKKGKTQKAAPQAPKKPVAQKEEGEEIFDEEEEEDEDLTDKKKKKKVAKTDDDGGIDLGEEEEEEEEEEEDEDLEEGFIINKLNSEHKLGYKLDKIKALVKEGKFGKEEEAELVSTLFKRVVSNANKQLAQYQGVANLMKDEEVRSFLEAKKAGKTLKDIATAYASSVQGMTDDAIVSADLKKKYPSLSDQEITDMVSENSKKGLLAKMANAVREENKKTETLTAQQAALKAEQEAAEKEEEIKQDMLQFADFLKQVKSVHGVPVTDEMKKTAFIMTTVRDENGDTELDRVLQSNKGSLLAALGIKFMKTLISGASTSSTNKARKGILDLLEGSAEGLQSSGTRTKNSKKGEGADLYNRF